MDTRDFRGADLRAQDLNGADFKEADLSHANLSGADLSGADLSGANLQFANLAAARLGEANLQRASLKHACLHQADLQNADLSGANLDHADLEGANLGGADLDDAQLDHANLEGATLSGSSLIMSSLTHANLRNASLAAADLGWASLAGAAVCGTSFKEATYNFSTVWPDEPPEEVWPRLKEPPPDTILNAEPIGYSSGDGWLVYIGFGPTRFSTADFVAIPNVRSPEGSDAQVGCAYLRFKVFMEVLGDRATELGTRLGIRYYLPGINLRVPQDLALYEQLLERKVEPSPFPTSHGGECDELARQMHIWFDQ